MGMSASQARLLSITARLSDNEFEAQAVSHAKIRLASQSEQISTNYLNALSSKKMQIKTINSTGDSVYYDISNQLLQQLGYRLVDGSGRSLLTKATRESYEKFISDNADTDPNAPKDATDKSWGRVKKDSEGNEIKDENGNTVYENETYNTAYYAAIANGETETDAKAIARTAAKRDAWAKQQAAATGFDEHTTQYANYYTYYNSLAKDIDMGNYNEISTELYLSREYIENGLKNGTISLEQYKKLDDGTMGWKTDLWNSGNNGINEVADEEGLNQIEAKYEVDMQKIQSKDKRFDLSLKKLDSEHNALQTEYDSVKKVIDKNIETSFKMFS